MASCEPISCAELQTLLSQQERTQRRWAELGSTFWLKLVISKRSDILTKCAQYQTPTLDFVYIDLLKSLVGKSYGKIHKYFSDISQLLKSDISFYNLPNFFKSKSVKEEKWYSEIFKQLFGTQFMKLSPWWLTRCFKFHRKMCKVLSEIFTPVQHLELEFKFPCFWSHCKVPWPFEIFVRSRWGDNLFKSLGCKKEDIIWWSESKKCEFSPPQECKLNSDLYKIDSSVPIKFRNWLAPYSHTFVQGNYEREDGVVQFFGKDPTKALWWDVLELSFPPMWSKKFYSGPAAVTNDFTDSEGLDCCVWISMWLNTFGLEYMALLQETQQEFLTHGADHVEDGLSLKDRMLEYKKTLEFMHSLPNSPTLKDAPETAASFLLEPTLLIQLPWYHNLLQLWLAAALVEVTRCEIASMEFRHWPVPLELIPEVGAVLATVTICKDLLVSCLASLSYDIVHFPNIQVGYPAELLDKGILPLFLMLQFVIDRGIPFLTEFKRAAWGRGHPLGIPNKSEPSNVYTIRPAQSQFFHHHFFHIGYWMDEKPQVPYTDIRSNKESQFKMKPFVPFEEQWTDFCLKELSPEEALCEARLQNFTPKGDPRELVTRICQDVLSEAPTPEGIRSAERHALLAIKIAEFTSGLQTEESPSLLRCLVRLTGEALVREQEVRVAAICAQASGHPMALHDLPPDYDSEEVTDSFSDELTNVFDVQKKNLKIFNRTTLLSKIVPNTKILSGAITRAEILRNQEAGSTSTSFDKHCIIVMLCSLAANGKYRAFESMKQHTMELDPYTFFYIPSYFLIRASQTLTTSILLSSYIDAMLENCYKQTDFNPKLLQDMIRDPTVMDKSILGAPAAMSMAPQNIDRELAVCHALASLCMNDSDTVVKHIKGTFLLFLQNKIPRHKLDALLLAIFLQFSNKQCFIQTKVCDDAFSLEQDEGKVSNMQTLQDLCRVRANAASLSYQMMMFCDAQHMKNLLVYKLIVSMQPKLMEYSLPLLQAAMWQRLLKDSRYRVATLKSEKSTPEKQKSTREKQEAYKCSKKLRNEMSNFFANIFVVILVFKERKDVKELSQQMTELFPKSEKMVSTVSEICDIDFEETVKKEFHLKIPLSHEKRQEIISILAKQFLNITVEPSTITTTTVNKEETVAVAHPATTPVTEVCHICKKQASPGQNFITFEGKFYCSSQCKGSVQKQWCRFCKKREQPGQKFLQCAACQADPSYPDPNYFCSEECYSMTWWEEKHEDDHLEFELGLGRWKVSE